MDRHRQMSLLVVKHWYLSTNTQGRQYIYSGLGQICYLNCLLEDNTWCGVKDCVCVGCVKDSSTDGIWSPAAENEALFCGTCQFCNKYNSYWSESLTWMWKWCSLSSCLYVCLVPGVLLLVTGIGRILPLCCRVKCSFPRCCSPEGCCPTGSDCSHCSLSQTVVLWQHLSFDL